MNYTIAKFLKKSIIMSIYPILIPMFLLGKNPVEFFRLRNLLMFDKHFGLSLDKNFDINAILMFII